MRNDRFSGIRERLLRGGVSPRHVRRTMEELESHFADLVAARESTGLSHPESEALAATQLGSDDVLVASMLARPELRSWSRRQPWLAFGLLPVLAFAALFVLSIVGFVASLEFAQHSLGWVYGRSSGLHWVQIGLLVSTQWVAPLLAASATCVLAARRRAAIWWPLSATIVIGLLSAQSTVSVDWPPSAAHGTLSAGLGLSSDTLHLTLAHAALTIALVLIPYFWWQRTHQHVAAAPAE